MTVLVETDDGMAIRRIGPPSALDAGREQGLAAEDAVQSAAATWGLPDFVYRPAIRSGASGVRELGDGIVLVGDLGLVIQVKSRVALTQDVAKESRWLRKKMSDAARQAHGTIRNLRRQPADLVNERGRQINVDGNSYRWVAVVVIDHPRVPPGIETPEDSRTVALLRRDWEFLFDQLKSAHAVAAYLERVAGDSIELGGEPARYYEFATADAAAPPSPLPEEFMTSAADTISAPLLPLAPVGTDDRSAHVVVRSLLEDIATSPLGDAEEGFRVQALGELDRLPVGYRGAIGRFLLTALDEVRTVPPDETLWRFRSVRGPTGIAHLAFGAASRFSDKHQAGFSSWVQLKHLDMQDITGNDDLLTVGVLLTPRNGGRRPWDTSMTAVQGDLQLSSAEVAAYRELWPTNE